MLRSDFSEDIGIKNGVFENHKANIFLLFFFVLFAFSLGGVARASVLSDLAATLPERTFVKMPANASLNGLNINYSLFYYTDSGIWDPVKKQAAIVAGPGTCCASPAIYKRLTYNSATDIWSIVDTPFSGSGHAYDGNAVNPNTGLHYFSWWDNKQVQTWNGSSWGSLPSHPLSLACCLALSWFPEINGGQGGLVLTGSNNEVAWYNGTSWTTVAATPAVPWGDIEVFSEYNPVLKVVWMGSGGYGSPGSERVSYIMNSQFNLTRAQDAPFNLKADASLKSVDPVSGKFVVYDFGGQAWWEFDASNNTWTALTNLNSKPDLGNGSMFQVPIPEYGVILFFKLQNNGVRDVYLYKHSAGAATTDSQAPTVPSALAASAISSSQINLSWTASTDNVGVAGYKVYRCQGTGCAPVLLTTLGNVTSYSNTGLSASTVYAYAVSAYDAAGNNSAQSASVSATTLSAPVSGAPYPPSTVISGITWDFAGLTRAAPGSDLWPMTWSDDDNLYTAWGDGGGFGGDNSLGRVSFGVGKVQGTGSSWQGFNVWGGLNPISSQTPTTGKSNGGIISINGVLYVFVEEENVWTRSKLWTSADHGLTWADRGFVLDWPGPAFGVAGLIQFGKDYAGARDNYVYGYSERGMGFAQPGLGLFRVPKDQLVNKAAYEFFSGLDVNSNPTWSTNVSSRQPVFTDPNGVYWGVNAMYNPVLGRYIMAVAHTATGDWGIFEAPNPWGPWRTVAYYSDWIDSTQKFTFVFPQKWMSLDSRTMYMIFSGTGVYDSFNVIKGTLNLAVSPPADTTPPTAPGALSAAASGLNINLTWQAATDAESGVSNYKIYRRTGITGTYVLLTSLSNILSFTDSQTVANTTYFYQVSAVNGAGLEGNKSNEAFAVTGNPPPQPVISNLTVASGKTYQIVSGGLATGALQYIDRTYTFSSVPASLQGLTYVKTANDDKDASPGSSSFMSFNVDRNSTIYVAHDDRIPRPAWLSSSFADTGLDLKNTGGDTLSLFKKDFSAGTVTLGSNVTTALNDSMYTVVIAASGGTTSGDTTSPTVSITSPAGGSTVSGSITVSASASDIVGVAGVQFKLDGANLGAEDVSSPYSTTWDTTFTTNGSHSLTATARDAAGNIGVSSAVSVNVSNATAPPTACGSVTNPNTIIAEPTTSRPALLNQYTDPKFGACVTRVTDNGVLGTNSPVHTYSQLQAWNADMSLLLLKTDQILNASTFQLVHTLNFSPDGGKSVRWSPTEPNVLYYLDNNDSFCSGAALLRYRLIPGSPMTRQRELVRCFPEYTTFLKDESWEQMSDNGRYIALLGQKSDGSKEVFAYDVINSIKSPTLAGQQPACGSPDWVGMSPSGKYIMVNWGGGGDARYCGLEAYDLSMNYLGKTATGHGHGDLAIDKNGTEWYVYYTHDNYVGITGPRIVKAQIPRGYDSWKANNSTGLFSLLLLDWYVSGHISCQGSGSGWCVGSTGVNLTNGWRPFTGEVFKFHLDSTEAVPRVERLAHHRSDESYVGSFCSLLSYWAQPHASVSPNGSKIIYGSSWEQNCFAESYIIALSATSSAPAPPILDTTPPAVPKNLFVIGVTALWEGISYFLANLALALQVLLERLIGMFFAGK